MHAQGHAGRRARLGRKLTQDFSKAWRGIVSVEAPVRSNTDAAVLDELDLALGPPFETEWSDSVLSFGKRDWLWVTHNWDPFVYVSHGRVQAVGRAADGAQTFRFELHLGSRLAPCVLIAGAILVFVPSPESLPLAGLFSLGGIMLSAMVPRLFVMKVQRLVEAAGRG